MGLSDNIVNPVQCWADPEGSMETLQKLTGEGMDDVLAKQWPWGKPREKSTAA